MGPFLNYDWILCFEYFDYVDRYRMVLGIVFRISFGSFSESCSIVSDYFSDRFGIVSGSFFDCCFQSLSDRFWVVVWSFWDDL